MRQRLGMIAFVPLLLTTISVVGTANQSEDPWTLVFRDDFDRFDARRWEKATHTWDGNASRFRPENVTFQDGRMRLSLKKESFQDRQYTGGELRTRPPGGFFRHGRFVVRMKAARGSSVVSSFFTYR